MYLYNQPNCDYLNDEFLYVIAINQMIEMDFLLSISIIDDEELRTLNYIRGGFL